MMISCYIDNFFDIIIYKSQIIKYYEGTNLTKLHKSRMTAALLKN